MEQFYANPAPQRVDEEKLVELVAVRTRNLANDILEHTDLTEEEALNSPAYSREDSAYREYLVKLRSLPDHLLTAPARKFAAERAAFMRAFFDRLNEEQEGLR